MPDTARRNLSDELLTQVVLESFDNAQSPRIKEVLQSLVKHLHAFAVDVQLTEEEWAYGIDFLTRTGHISDDKRQEFILLSDVLGLSMQVIGINHAVPDGATENTVFGPFFVANSPAFSIGDDIANGASGIPCYFHGDVRAGTGETIEEATSRSGWPTTKATTTSSTTISTTRRAAATSPPPTTAGTGSGRCCPRPIRSRTTARSATS